MEHTLKTIQPYFNLVWEGVKTFEVRINDRAFQAGDKIILKEYDKENNTFSGRRIEGKILFVLSDYPAVERGYVVFNFEINCCIS